MIKDCSPRPQFLVCTNICGMEDTSGDKDNYIDKSARQLDGILLTFVLHLKVETDLFPFIIKLKVEAD